VDDLVGKKFGLLTVLSVNRRKYHPISCFCQCDCGGTHTVRSDNLIHGRVKRCKNPVHRQKYTTKEKRERKNRIDRARRAANKLNSYSDEDIKIINMRVALKTNTEILSNTYYTKGQMQGLFRKHFKGKDPLAEHISNLVKSGRSLKSVCRELHLSTGMVSQICSRRGIVPPGSPKRKVKKKPKDHRAFAEDCYCYYIENKSIRDTSRAVGYKNGASLSNLFRKYIPGYQVESKKKRDNSYRLQGRGSWFRKSELYRFEKNFQKDCVATIKERYSVIDDPPRFSFTPDVISYINDGVIFMEMKTAARKVDLAKALGQSIIYRYQGLNHYYKNKRVFSLICIPDDLNYPETFVLAAMTNDVITCKQSELLKELSIIDEITQ
jgi:hypothetical protein